nr:Subtilisin-like protease SBT1.7 [Ipomoea batatas]
MSSSLLLLGATITLACSSKLKFCHLNPGSIYSRYNSRISLWLMTPGLVKFHIPLQFRFAISMEIGSSSSSTVMLLGMLTTLLYREIFVIKFLGLVRSDEMGIRTLRVHTLSYSLNPCGCFSSYSNMQPVAKFIINSPCSLQTSAKVRVPTTFVLMVSALCDSHQSTFGLPVIPAALNTCVGLALAMSRINAPLSFAAMLHRNRRMALLWRLWDGDEVLRSHLPTSLSFLCTILVSFLALLPMECSLPILASLASDHPRNTSCH